MSEYEIQIGTAKEMTFSEGLSWEDKIRNLVERNYSFDEDLAITDHYLDPDEGFFRVGDRIFQIIENTDFEGHEDICEASTNPDGTISYVLKYYNGGTCFSEVVEGAILDMEKE